MLYDNYISKGIPAVMDECGCLDKKNLDARVAWSAAYVAIATSRGVPVAWWDNGAFHGSGENFGLLFRGTAKFNYPEIVQALVKGSEYQ